MLEKYLNIYLFCTLARGPYFCSWNSDDTGLSASLPETLTGVQLSSAMDLCRGSNYSNIGYCCIWNSEKKKENIADEFVWLVRKMREG